jgi:hypothetical protein
MVVKYPAAMAFSLRIIHSGMTCHVNRQQELLPNSTRGMVHDIIEVGFLTPANEAAIP